MYRSIIYGSFIVLLTGVFSSCNKKKFLDTLPDSNQFVLKTLSDLQSVLDQDMVMGQTPVMGEGSSDDYYLPASFWQTLPPREKNTYIWAQDIFENQGNVDDWNIPFQQIFYANTMLDALENIPATTDNRKEWNNIQGSALFFRAFAYYHLLQVFAPAYDNNTAGSDMGLPLRLVPSAEKVSERASVKIIYEQLIKDLEQASGLLPATINTRYLNRPYRPAAFALLAKTYLSMNDYQHAKTYADSSLNLYSTLMDYNGLNRNAPFPFSKNNAEILYQSKLVPNNTVLINLAVQDCQVDSVLYRQYGTNDLRPRFFFTTNMRGLPIPRASYTGSFLFFTGLATDEIYLIRAECNARLGNTQQALQDVNALLVTRWQAGTFTPYTAASATEALTMVLAERRKELVFRSCRFTDLRRLNKTGANISIQRVLDGNTYTLPPNDKKYVLPIPPDAIALSGMTQNPR
jgi:starch-binding outer membrane protein, SusD/RagB family